jgi:hypothetical protein
LIGIRQTEQNGGYQQRQDRYAHDRHAMATELSPHLMAGREPARACFER